MENPAAVQPAVYDGKEVTRMAGCEHVFKSKGEYYRRRPWILGGDIFTVFRYRECIHCNKLERKVKRKKRITDSPEKYERQLKFSGIKPENQLN
jgi:hypothetical protein